MRTGGYAVHQTLTADAATIVKQALTLAKRRGHSQVTPLHVATAMLASPTGLLRSACLQSHSQYPFQCKALELCLNVALNRLPTSPSSPILGPLSLLPSLSNALVAAFKRAQAHQRRGSVENQQQPILALKVELEQLVISILDDPSVSRVMREAGFSSTQVKTNVEQAVSVETSSKSPCRNPKEITKSPCGDVMSVLDSLMKKRNSVIVRECLASAESVVKGIIDKFDRGDVPLEFRNVQFISLPISTLKNISLLEAEQKVKELRWLVKTSVGRGVVLYLGDLKWVAEFWSSNEGQSRNFYCPVELMVMEISRLVSGIINGENGKLWLMGIATSQIYMKCKGGNPSLDTLWKLYPLTIQVANLGLSLNLDHSDLPSEHSQFKLSRDESGLSEIKKRVEKYLSCCVDCLANFNKEAKFGYEQSIEINTTSTNLSLPFWLQQQMEENQRKTSNDQEFNKVRELCKKWNSICNSVHKKPHFLEKPVTFSPSSSTSSSNENHTPNLHPTLLNWPVIFEPKQSPKEHQFFFLENNEHEKSESCLKKYVTERMEPKPDLLSNPNSSPNSASSSEIDENVDYADRLKEFNSESLHILSKPLEKKVPWQKEIIPDIASTILECRGGMLKRSGKTILKEAKEETWLFFSGTDLEGKEKVAKELAKVLFGSYDEFVTIGLSNFSSTREDSSEEISKKRSRAESGSSYFERFAEALDENPNRVFLMEDAEQIDYFSQKGFKKAMESGEILLNDELVPLKKAIVIFSCESLSSISRACSPLIKNKSGEENEDIGEAIKEDTKESVPLDLNVATGDDFNDENYVSQNGILDLVDKQITFKV